MVLTLRSISYAPIALKSTDLELIPADLITSGIDCLGVSRNTFDDAKFVRFRNIQNRTIFAILNSDPLLDAYIRIKTAARISSLDLEDLIINIPANSGIQLLGGFTDIFQTQGTVTETILGAPVERTYNDFIEFNLSHDSSTPVIRAGAMYV